MLYREVITLFADPHKTHTYILCGLNVQLLNVKLVVHIVTTGP